MEEEQDTKKILQRLSEVLDVLSKISEDLQDISKSLKIATQTTRPSPPTITSSKTIGRGVEDVRMMFTKELEDMLIFEDKESYIMVKPKQYLGSDNFAKIASAIRDAGGEYISAGRDSHFRVPK